MYATTFDGSKIDSDLFHFKGKVTTTSIHPNRTEIKSCKIGMFLDNSSMIYLLHNCLFVFGRNTQN